ncbi:hypothetical protein [Bradyrhizobium liaoningense]|uniref:hypothetical protein n=1 Tax=Bradyrhizobium liaoningense TaxID=43992 RepID=UPI0005557394|nr:hypothetical protein [Bradyrhizobium liaoningense]
MNYFVVARGHIAQFEQYGAAWAFADDFGGVLFNLWGLLHANEDAPKNAPKKRMSQTSIHE